VIKRYCISPFFQNYLERDPVLPHEETKQVENTEVELIVFPDGHMTH
jgi:hypothetical protein